MMVVGMRGRGGSYIGRNIECVDGCVECAGCRWRVGAVDGGWRIAIRRAIFMDEPSHGGKDSRTVPNAIFPLSL